VAEIDLSKNQFLIENSQITKDIMTMMKEINDTINDMITARSINE